ncbi:MAG: CHAT domain-containing protein, partial [Rhodospirillales bacterium]|nr:CHAT domain-containing protein [Rhodospirillales bacterium]
DVMPLLGRALKIREAALGADHPDIAVSLNNMGESLQQAEDYEAAENAFRRSAHIFQNASLVDEETEGDFVRNEAISLNNLARVLSLQKKGGEAEAQFIKALSVLQSEFFYEDELMGIIRGNFAAHLAAEGRYDEARNLYDKALKGQRVYLPDDHPKLAHTYNNLATLYRKQGLIEEAFAEIKKASRIYEQRALLSSGRTGVGAGERDLRRLIFTNHIQGIFDVRNKRSGQNPALTIESLKIGQLARATSAGAAVARMSARFAAGDNALAKTIRAHQDTIDEWREIDAAVVKSLGSKERGNHAALKAKLLELSIRIKSLETRLETDFPEYAELASPKPVDLVEIQNLLGSSEALVSYIVSKSKTYLWVVRQNAAFMTTLNVGSEILSEVVYKLREALNPEGISSLARLPTFERKLAHVFYQTIFAPAEQALVGVNHIFVVPDGALQSLPFGVLVSKNPNTKLNDFSDYAKVHWLAKKYALTTLPSISSLRALRTFAKRSNAKIPFIGIGDPVLKGHPGSNRGVYLGTLKNEKQDLVNAVRELPALPDTADELQALSRSVNGKASDLYLRDMATEKIVKRLDLSAGRIIAFATHGLIAGDLANAEPALVLTPPEKGSSLDDGLLTASEVAQLKIDADLVILSACNTAAGDGSEGAEGLSGLAKAFFYAGSRALLVSHWPVVSEAAVKLTTRMLNATVNDPDIGHSEALRRSMLDLIHDQEKPYFAHPLFWAPFVIVGEGGSYLPK